MPEVVGAEKIVIRDAEGAVTEEAMMKHGVLEGETVLYASGRVRARLYFEQGLQSGEARFYDDAGEVTTRAAYKKGKLEGDSFYYGADGKLVRKSAYRNGELNGYTTDYYPSGKPRQVSTYRDNLLDGDMVRLDEGGKVLERLHYKKGRVQTPPSAFKDAKLPGRKA